MWIILYKLGLAKREKKLEIIDKKKGIARSYTQYSWRFSKK